MNNLPVELRYKIFNSCLMTELLSMRLVCRSWNEIIMELFGPKMVYHIDNVDLDDTSEFTFVKSIFVLNQEKYSIKQVCIRKFKFIEYEIFLQKDDTPQNITNFFANIEHLKFDDCELSYKFLCFIVNQINHLKSLRMNVFIDKSSDSKIINLMPKIFDSLTELDLSNTFGLEDKSFVNFSSDLSNLNSLNCMHTKMVFYPNYIRRYYTNYDDLEGCWSKPTAFGFTFTLIRAFIVFVANKLEQIYLGPNISFINVLQMLKFDCLRDIHLLFNSKIDSDMFEKKIQTISKANGLNKRFHYHCKN